MMKMLKRFFIPDDSERDVKKIIWWWELRRIAYNAVLLCLGLLSIFSYLVFVNDPFSFLSPPLFAMVGILMYAFMANICYTFGWIVEVFTLKVLKSETKKLAKIMLITGFTFASLLTISPGCFVMIASISGNPLTSPYYTFTKEQPLRKNLIGVYEMDSTIVQSIKRKNISIADIPTITLNDDGTFEAESMPCFLEIYKTESKTVVSGIPEIPIDYYVEKAELFDIKGKWELKSYDIHENWRIEIKFESAVPCNSPLDTVELEGYNSFNLRNNEPPYEIYIIRGDPDSWEYFLYTQKD